MKSAVKRGSPFSVTLSPFLFTAFAIATSCDVKVRDMDPEEEVIRSIRDISNRAIARHDTATMASVLTDNFHMITSRNAEASGNHNAVKMFAQEFKARPDVSYVRTPSRVRIFQQWNSASEVGRWVGKWSDSDGAIEVSGTYYAKWIRIQGKWLIRGEIFVARSCKGGKFCETSPV
jgi:hypothetical protein